MELVLEKREKDEGEDRRWTADGTVWYEMGWDKVVGGCYILGELRVDGLSLVAPPRM